MRLVVTCLLALLITGQILPASLWATTYYVATTGSDSNPGTSGSPFLTLQKGHDVAVAGDIILVEDGVYTTALTTQMVLWSRSGTAGNPITMKAINRGGAKLDGNDNATSMAFNLTGSHLVIDGFEIYRFGAVSAFNMSATGTDIAITKTHMHHIGNVCTLTSFGITGIYMGTGYNHITMDENIYHDIGRLQPAQCPTGFYSNTGNTNYKNHDHAIYLEATTDVFVTNSVFYNQFAGWDLQIYPQPVTRYFVSNNTFANPNTNVTGYILFGSGSSVTSSDFSNNIFLFPTGGCGIAYGGSFGGASNVTVRHNLTQGGAATCSALAGVTVSGSLDNTNPLITNASTHDYHLQASSPAINAGLNLSGMIPVNDQDNITRPSSGAWDIGAYTHSSDITPPSDVTGVTTNPVASTEIDLSWTPATDDVGVDHYLIESCSGIGCSGFVQIGTSLTTTYHHTGLTPSTNYSYRLKAVDAAGNVSVNYSSIVSDTTQTGAVLTPAAPSFVPRINLHS